MHSTFSVGDLTAVIGDNSAHEKHKAGYNGLWSLTHKSEPANLFVPEVAGFNLEHIFDGATLDPGDGGAKFFEPRHAPGVADALRALGHDLVPTAEFDSNVGHEHAIELIDGGPAAGGSLQAATDPRSEGLPAVW